MRMIIGGAYQGKTDYAKQKYNLSDNEIADGENFNLDVVPVHRCISRFHLLVRKLIEAGKDPLVFAERMLNENPDIIIIMDEIGNGIIPIEKSERIWREVVGKTGCFLACRAESVERIVCGTVVKIKG